MYDIIFPFYKDYYFLKKAIENINKQSVLAKNLIFIDDGNKDNDLKNKIKLYLNKKINLIYIKNLKNIKVEKSLNKGFNFIKSKYFFLIAADDIYSKYFAEKTLKVLKKFKKAPFCFSRSEIYNLNKKKIYKLSYDFLKQKYYDKSQVRSIFKKNQFKIYINTVIFRKNFFIKNHIMKEEFHHRADMINLLYLSFKYGFCYCNQSLSKFTIRPNQYGSKILPDNLLINELDILRKKKLNFYKYFLSICMHYDLSVFSIIKLLRKKHYHAISIKWLFRSIKFRVWKQIRFLVSPNMLNFLFKLFK